MNACHFSIPSSIKLRLSLLRLSLLRLSLLRHAGAIDGHQAHHSQDQLC
jgi:hypothetical protein